MWWQDLMMGFWNRLAAWVVLVAHAFDAWDRFAFYDTGRSGTWYGFGFLVEAGPGRLGVFGRDGAHRGRSG